MSIQIRMTHAVHAALRRYHLDSAFKRERISYLFGRSVRGLGGLETILLAKAPILLSDDCYVGQSGGHVALAPDVLNAILAAFAATDFDVLVNVHDHWFHQSGTSFSAVDTADDVRLARYIYGQFEPMLRRRPDIGRPRKIISLALVLDQEGLAARYIDHSGRFHAIDRVEIVGPLARRINCNGARGSSPTSDPTLLRQSDFVTAAQADYIAGTTFGIVGCGGLGSIAGEALLRLGARRFLLFDDDVLEAHNLNRWQGGRPRDIGRDKTTLLAARLRRMGPPRSVKARPVSFSVLDPRAMTALRRCDVLIGCLDNHLARSFVNRFAVQFLAPIFDAGVNIRVEPVVNFESRFYSVIPGYTACAECTAYQLIDEPEVERALIDDVTLSARRRAGYVDDHPEMTTAASAYSLNLRAVSTLVQELLNWIGGYRPFASCVSEAWLEGRYQRSDRDNHPETPDPDCVNCALLLGAGDHAELPRPRPAGHAARILTEARALLAPAPTAFPVAGSQQ